jgi:hypothetical protein
MKSYDSGLSLADARQIYFEENAFGIDGGYGDRWVTVKLGPLSFRFLNTKARVRAVRFHDLHHVVTGYETSFSGELEISAWEIGSGCADMVAAWYLNLGGMGWGAFLAPRKVWRAFLRGRASKNLYRTSFDDTLLAATVGEVRARLGLVEPAGKASPLDVLLYGSAAALGFLLGTAMFAVFTPLAIMGAVGKRLSIRRVVRAEGHPGRQPPPC